MIVWVYLAALLGVLVGGTWYATRPVKMATYVIAATKPGERPRQITIFGQAEAAIEIAKHWMQDGFRVVMTKNFQPWEDWEKD